MEGPFCRRNTGRGWSGDSDSSYRPLPVGPCRQGYRKERMEADSTRSRLPAVPPNEKIVQYQQGTAPLLPALSQVADMRPFRTDWPEGFYGDACVPRQTAVPALDVGTSTAPPNPPCPTPHTVSKPQQKLVTVLQNNRIIICRS